VDADQHPVPAFMVLSRSIRLLLSGCLLALAACENGDNEYLRQYAHGGASPASFYVCYGYSCKYSARVVLRQDEWQSVRAIIEPAANQAPARATLRAEEWQSKRAAANALSEEAAERTRISLAMARFDQLVGARIGTLVHQRREYNSGDPSQYDCIDESINTWTYLSVLDHEGLLHYHAVGDLAHAGTVLDFDVRNTATLTARVDGRRYAIDPTLVDVGEPPPIVPLQSWVASYPPEASAVD
jgi:hypothetical protein